MLDFNHILSNPGTDLQYFLGTVGNPFLQMYTWVKPRNARMCFLVCVSGGASGGTGIVSGSTSGGGGGGGCGTITSLIIPAMFLPNILYLGCGSGGLGPTTAGSVGTLGTQSVIQSEPFTSSIGQLLVINSAPTGTAGAGAATTGGGGGVGGGYLGGTSCFNGRGIKNELSGLTGGAGGSNLTAGTATTLNFTQSMLTAGAGGGGSDLTGAFAGGSVSGMGSTANLQQELIFTAPGGAAAVGATPAGNGGSGITKNFLMNLGGSGGGGASQTAGGTAGAGGNGAPGCGGGGGGGGNTTNPTVGKGGDGGPGFVFIMSW